MDTTTNTGGEGLLKTEVTRRGTLTAAAWAAPVIAVAAATPAAVASGVFDPTTDLVVGALGGAEGRYATGQPYTNGVVSANNDFRRAFYIDNIGSNSFTGTLRVDFKFPGMWNNWGSGNSGAFNNWDTVDLGGAGGSIGGASSWTITNTTSDYVQNWGTNANTDVWQRMDTAYLTLNNVNLPAGARVWFALNAVVPNEWIGTPGVFLPGSPDDRIYWRSDVTITAISAGGAELGTYVTPVGAWDEGIWYWNGGGPWAYDGGQGLYPAHTP